jgi:hypothetical protein
MESGVALNRNPPGGVIVGDEISRYSLEDLRSVKELVATSGLIKVYDGREWVDLRMVMRDVLDYAIELRGTVAALQAQSKGGEEEPNSSDDVQLSGE